MLLALQTRPARAVVSVQWLWMFPLSRASVLTPCACSAKEGVVGEWFYITIVFILIIIVQFLHLLRPREVKLLEHGNTASW